MLYEKLNREMQRMVDQYAKQLAPLNWQGRSDLLAESALPFAEDLEPDQAPLAAKGFMTAVLERWSSADGSAVDDPHQACLYLVSLNPRHREAAERYFEEHPDLQALVDRELAPPGES